MLLPGRIVVEPELKAGARARSCLVTQCLISLQNWQLTQLMPVGILQGWDCTFPVRSIRIVGSPSLPSACSWHLCSPPCLENEPEILHTVNDPAAQSSLELS